MKEWHPFAQCINLHVKGRIDEIDAQRQEITAREVLRRLGEQPGLVVADEVGMGKTYVALAVAASVALDDAKGRPVVIMVPPSLKKKWPQDFGVFSNYCLTSDVARRVQSDSADSAISFFRLLDEPEERKKSIIFLTHGAMYRGLSDGWVKLAMIQRALHRRHDTAVLRRSLCRCAGDLLRLNWAERYADDLWERLLDSAPEAWSKILRDCEILSKDDDDPVPRVIIGGLYDLDATDIFRLLQEIPQRQSASYDQRVAETRSVLAAQLKEVWRQCLTHLKLRLPLLIMDEAHHLKNPETHLSGLFKNLDAKNDAEQITRGPLGGIFERMLFLTATPFQLGHHELCSVLDTFEGIAWDASGAPACGRETFHHALAALRERLDAAQRSARNLDDAWGRLESDDLVAAGRVFGMGEVEGWWDAQKTAKTRPPEVEQLMARYDDALQAMRAAEKTLKPWVIRHLRERTYKGHPRRLRLPGRAIITDIADGDEAGMAVCGEDLLPFLLAARATACAPESRPVFAEGLASSYEAFLETRQRNTRATDGDDDDYAPGDVDRDHVCRWYLDRLQAALPRDDRSGTDSHPKVSATAKRVLKAWQMGEKVLVFCHYVRTGQVLRQEISSLITNEINKRGAEKLACSAAEASQRLEALGARFFDSDSSIRMACDAEVKTLLQNFPTLFANPTPILDLTRRYLRTSSFLARFFPLFGEKVDLGEIKAAFAAGDGGGLSLRDALTGFFDFLENHCVNDERQAYLKAIGSIQTGTIMGDDARGTFVVNNSIFAEDECQGTPRERLLPNVRLVNGAVKSETRQRLMLAFNSPFFPEVLVASSVMAEGVDLHRFCNYVIHHDLCWNPSTLEQRTGRVDRIGGKVERCGQPIRVYLPYLAETQDEKQYRVVMDRERWFSVVMGEQFRVDAKTTEKLARRVPLPASLARALAFQLSVVPSAPSECRASITDAQPTKN